MSIPAGTKFIGIAPGVDTVEKKSTQANSPSNVYTIEDIQDGSVPDTRTITINGSTQDLSANRTYNVTDANLSTSDITTNDVSITKHGFAPKAPNDTSKFLSGDGTWRTINTGLTVGTTPVTSGTDGRVFFQAGGVVQQSANLFWDNTNNTLGIGTSTPSSSFKLDVNGDARFNGGATSSSGTQMLNAGIRILTNAGNSGGISFDSNLPVANRLNFNSNFTIRSNSAITSGVDISLFSNSVQNSTNTVSLTGISGNVFSTSGGNNQTNGLLINPTINLNAGNVSTIFRGIHYSPTLTSTTGLTHRAIETTTGDVIFGSTSGNVAIGSTSPGARLDVRAQGALSTDIAFRVRNSADSANLFTIQGDGDITLFRPTSIFSAPMKIFGPGGFTIAQFQHETFGSIALGLGATFDFQTYGNVAIGQGANTTGGGGAVSIGLNNRAGSSETISIGYTSKCIGAYAIKIGSHAGASSFGGTNSIHLGRTTSGNDVSPDNVFMTYFNSQSSSTLTRSNGSFGLLGQQAYILQNGTGIYGTDTFMGNGGNTLVVRNHPSVPSTNITDSFQLYSNDITAGNSAPHFRTENGAIVKVYQETTGVGASTLVGGGGTTLTDTDTFDGYTLKQIVKALRNQGLLA